MKKALPPTKPKNKDRRAREYLTPAEIEDVMSAARNFGRHGYRDSTMILIAYRHGLRVSELTALKWQQVDLKTGVIHISRLKNGINGPHPLFGPELRALNKMSKRYPDTQYVFVSERKGPLTTSTFRKILSRAGIEANIKFPIHPHMLRHSTGFKLANDKQDTRSIQQYLGHKNINHTVKYTLGNVF
jgi:type 1 fimbriae regulatory protein FimB/type 1 fimbriae regulatory protein FimE